MDQKELRDWEARCIQEEPPACRAGCPLGVDARAFALAMAKDDWDAARIVLERSMPIPGIVARLCEAPCERSCLRGALGGPVAVGLLERACIRSTLSRGKTLRLPARKNGVTVIGGGPSSLTVAVELAKKGYPVTLQHHQDGPGGWLRDVPEALLPKNVLAEELQRLQSLGVRFQPLPHDNAPMPAPDPDTAVYLGLDDPHPAEAAAASPPDPRTFALSTPGLFAGGLGSAHHPFRFITDVAQGREAAISIDRFLQGASLTASRPELRHGATALYTNTAGIPPRERILPADPAGFTHDEAVREAGRCIDCQCLECVKHCVFLAEYKAYPKVYARRVYNNSAIVKGIHQTNAFINSCSLCRQCEILCPHGFSMADLCLEARRLMVREKRMPPSAHWFALEEMHSARSEGALARHAPGQIASRTVFFPGCQLAGIRPRQTLRLYDHLRETEAETGIWLDCCAAPAYWAGQMEEFDRIRDQLEATWITLGRPRIVTACSTCLQMFHQHLPQIDAASVWTELVRHPSAATQVGPALALSDPCTARHDAATQTAVRTVLAVARQPLVPLPLSGEITECCGFGGLMASAAPSLARKVAERRAAQTEATILTYCAMCRDQLATTGKPVLHLLDILFSDSAHPATEPPVSISSRRTNRRWLKAEFLQRCGQAGAISREAWQELALAITPPVANLLEERRILEDDIRQVLFLAETKGTFFAHDGSETRIATARLGHVTFWVAYHKIADIHHIERAWSHRMDISGGRS